MSSGRRPSAGRAWRLAAAAAALLAGGCSTLRIRPPRLTRLESAQIVIPATRISNYLVIETRGDKGGPYHFLIDTGASVTLVTPEFARLHETADSANPPRSVRVRSADGNTTLLPEVTLRRLQLGAARFEGVRALVYDLVDLSNHLGVKIDAVLGFPLFRETLLTLDYPHARILITPRNPPPTIPGTTIAFNNEQNTPLIPVSLGSESFIVLLDSGSDAGLSLNPVGLHPKFSYGPRPGLLVSTLTGNHQQMIGRLDEPLTLGTFVIDRPVAELTDDLSSLGGGVLKYFTVTFDQKRNQVTFERDSAAPLVIPPQRSTGLSFTKAPAYWRVAGVVPASPAARDGVQAGDLCIRINGEAVDRWNYQRYADLLKSAPQITYTFINGLREHDLVLPVFDLVP